MSIDDDLQVALNRDGIGLTHVRIASGATGAVSTVLDELASGDHVAVLVDEVEYLDARGRDVKAAVLDRLRSSYGVTVVTLPGDVHADEATVAAAVQGCAGANSVVTVGSGTLCDIGKVAAGRRPHVVVQSAASVNGFADDQSVLVLNGVKRTRPSAWPAAIVVDEDVLAGAPSALNRSGLGDLISTFTAPADWYLSSLFDLDRGYDHDAATMTRRHGEELLAIAPGVGIGDPEALATLARLLTLSGLSMGVAGQTSPSSGMEHTVSHLLDMAHGAKGMPNAWHGEQVGVASVAVSLLWSRVLERIETGDLAPVRLPEPERAEHLVHEAFGGMDDTGATARECWADYSAKLAHLAAIDAPARWAEQLTRWASHARTLRSLLGSAEAISGALVAAGAPARFTELSQPVDDDTATWALRSCHLMRNRFTVADLAFLTGCWGEAEVGEVLAQAERLAVSSAAST